MFARYRPRQCVHPKVTARDTCACPEHENMKMLINYLQSKKMIIENSHYQLTKSITCEKSTLDCFSRKCDEFHDKKITLELNEDFEEIHTFKMWKTSKEKRINEKTNRDIIVTIAKKVELSMSTKELKDHFHEQLESFMSYLHTLIHQDQAFKKLKSSLKDNKAVILIDFSQNYLCKFGTEIQRVHFGASRTQITLHTGLLYTKNSKQGFATLSDNLRHDSCAVTAHLKEALTKLKAAGRLKNINTLHFVSDGPTAQYKNKNTFYLVSQYLSNEFPDIKNITYNYSESGHGKNAADGIGAALKQTADDLVKYGIDIPDYATFLKYMLDKNKNIIVSNVTKQDIDAVNKELPKNLKTVPGTRKIFQMRWNSKSQKIVHFNYFSCFEYDVGVICTHSAKTKFDYSPPPPKKEISKPNKISNISEKSEVVPRKRVKTNIKSVETLLTHKIISKPNPKAAKPVLKMVKITIHESSEIL